METFHFQQMKVKPCTYLIMYSEAPTCWNKKKKHTFDWRGSLSFTSADYSHFPCPMVEHFLLSTEDIGGHIRKFFWYLISLYLSIVIVERKHCPFCALLELLFSQHGASQSVTYVAYLDVLWHLYTFTYPDSNISVIIILVIRQCMF